MSNIISGVYAKGKIIMVSPYEDEGEPKLLQLSPRQRQVLLNLSEYLNWLNRWKNVPEDLEDKDTRDAWIDEIRERLMTDIEICAEIINCITTDNDVQKTLSQFIQEQTGGQPFQPGQPLPPEETARNIVGTRNPTCNYDILYAQCREVVWQTHLAILDVLEKVEVSTNVAELIDAVWDLIPALGTLDDISGIEGAIELINYYQEAVLETYSAQFTETVGGTLDELSFGLFCYCRTDCTISIDKILQFYSGRLSGYISVPSLSGFVNLVETLAGINQDTSFVVDLAHWAAWGLLATGGFFFGKRYNQTLEFIIRFKADEPSNDWEDLALIFGDCPEEVLLTPIVLQSAWDTFPVPAGYDLAPVSGEPGYWMLNSTNVAAGQDWIILEEEHGQPFSIGSRSFPDGLDSALYYGEIDGNITQLFFTSTDHHNLTKVALAMFNGTPNARFKFRFYRPA